MPKEPKRQVVETPSSVLLLMATGLGLMVIVMAGIWFAFFRH